MGSGADHGYRMECEARDTRALQRRYAQGPMKRSIVSTLNEAKALLLGAKASFEAADEKVLLETKDRRAFYEETEELEYIVRRLEKMAGQIPNLGIDLQAIVKTHEHHYTSDDLDEGCTVCGICRRSGPIRA